MKLLREYCSEIIQNITVGLITKIGIGILFTLITSLSSFHGMNYYFRSKHEQEKKQYDNVFEIAYADGVIRKMSDMVNNCGVGSGSAWMRVDMKDNEALLTFKEVIALPPLTKYAFPTKLLNSFYTGLHAIDDNTVKYFRDSMDGKVLVMTEEIAQDMGLAFLQEIFMNAWQKTNEQLSLKGLPQIVMKPLYIVLVKRENNVVYIISLALNNKKYCNFYNTIQGTQAELKRISDLIKTDILKQPIN